MGYWVLGFSVYILNYVCQKVVSNILMPILFQGISENVKVHIKIISENVKVHISKGAYQDECHNGLRQTMCYSLVIILVVVYSHFFSCKNFPPVFPFFLYHVTGM